MGAYFDQRTGQWRYDFTLRGERHTARGYRTKASALAAEASQREQIMTGGIPIDPYPTMEGLVAAYLTASRRTQSEDWAKQKQDKLNKAFADLALLHPREVKPAHIERALNKVRSWGNGARSVNEYRKIAHALFSYAVDQEVIDKNPVAKIKREVEPDSEVEWIPKAHLNQLALAAEDPVDKAVLIVLAQTGARFVQLQRLRWPDLKQSENGPVALMRTKKNKGGRWRVYAQPLNGAALAGIETMRGRDPVYVFPGRRGGMMIYNTFLDRLQKLCDRLELPRYSFHKVRHLVGYLTSKPGRNKKAVAKFLGHSNTNVTDRYMHAADPELWEIAKAMEAEFAELAQPATAEPETIKEKA
jgi:integrase